MIKTFRGLLADNEIRRIKLSTNDGLTGYKIVKFQLMGEKPAGENQESVVQIWSVDPENDVTLGLIALNEVNFESPTLLGAAYLEAAADAKTESQVQAIIFDQTKFNQDIYVSQKDSETGAKCNYYIELEQVKLDLNEATVATLKDMRGRE